jgi:hypothetical protein
MTAANTAPLTFGQLSVWRDVEALPRDRWHEANTALRIDVPRGLDAGHVADALSDLERDNPSLRTRYRLDDPEGPLQVVDPVRETSGGLTVCALDTGAATSFVDDFARQPFDLRSQHPWRAVLGLGDDGTRQLVLSKHHIACDAWSVGLIERAVRNHLVGRRSQQPTADDALLRLALSQRDDPVWQRKRQRSIALFERATALNGSSFPDSAWADGGRQAYVESSYLAERVRAAVEQSGVSPATVLLTAYLAALAEMTMGHSLRVDLMSSNRIDPRFDRVVTSMNQWVPVVIDRDALDGRLDTAALVQRISMSSYRAGAYSVDDVDDYSSESDDAIGAFNFVDPWDSEREPDPGADPVIHWEPTFSLIGPRCYLRAIMTRSGSIALRLRTRNLAPEVTETIIRRMFEIISGTEQH